MNVDDAVKVHQQLQQGCIACHHRHPQGMCRARVREHECLCLREHHDGPEIIVRAS
jgi:hypothetical protein